MATKYMNLDLPVPGVTKGPDWAVMINDAFTAIDGHDHSSGKGQLVDSSYITINSNLDFTPSSTAYGIQNTQFCQLTDLYNTGTPDIAGALFNWRGDLWWQYNTTGVGTGTFTQITSYDQVISRGSHFEPIQIAGSYEISPIEKISALFIATSTNPHTITLPNIDYTPNGKYYLIQDTDGNANTNNITITPSALDTIQGLGVGASYTINTNYGCVWIVADWDTNFWFILTSN
jgi:hypothetical protein